MSNNLAEEYPYKTELHSHSKPVSHCGELTVKEAVDLQREAGMDSMVLTNHFMLWQSGGYYLEGDSADARTEFYLDAWREAHEYGKRTGIEVLLGIEIRFTNEHEKTDYLVYGIDEDDVRRAYGFLDKGIDVFYREFKNEKNVILQAHPFRDGMLLADPNSLDGIEAFNMHPNHNSRPPFAARYAREHQLLVTGGSDCHRLGESGLCVMRTKRKMETSYDVAQTIKSRDYLLEIFGNFITPYQFSGGTPEQV